MEKKVLVVEDEQSLLSLYTSVLEQAQNDYIFDVYRAGNVEEALLLSEQHQFDVLLTDYHLPGKDGIYLIKELKKQKASIACVIISGYLSSDITKAAKEAGAYTCLKKPCSIYLIKGTIEEALNYQSAIGGEQNIPPDKIPLHREVQCLIDNYPNKTAFIDNTFHIIAANNQFKKSYSGAIDATCHNILHDRSTQCPDCPLLNGNLKKQILLENKSDSAEPLTEYIDIWQDRDGVQHGYIISCIKPDET